MRNTTGVSVERKVNWGTSIASGLQALCDTADDNQHSHFKEWLLSAVYDKKEFTDTSLNTDFTLENSPTEHYRFA